MLFTINSLNLKGRVRPPDGTINLRHLRHLRTIKL
jgi:hypothetical protein